MDLVDLCQLLHVIPRTVKVSYKFYLKWKVKVMEEILILLVMAPLPLPPGIFDH